MDWFFCLSRSYQRAASLRPLTALLCLEKALPLGTRPVLSLQFNSGGPAGAVSGLFVGFDAGGGGLLSFAQDLAGLSQQAAARVELLTQDEGREQEEGG